jgi:hypothetical protein
MMNSTIEPQAQNIDTDISEQTLRALGDIELVLVGGGEFLALGG